jgi:undecaprenyl-diphosphatase
MFGPYLEALLLGVVQGITEFLPISSDGHLALAEILFELKAGGLTFNVMLHAGTLLATLVMLRSEVREAVKGGFQALRHPRLFLESSGGRDALTVVVASIPTAAIGLFLRDAVESFTDDPLAIGLGFMGTALALVASTFAKRGDLEHPSVLGALAIGVAQGLAVLPGLSRSGSTIALALFLGVRPARAFALSMLMSLPAIVGAIGLEARHAFSGPFLFGPVALGAVAAFATGVVALLMLRHIVDRGRFGWFAFWVAPLSLATIALGLRWPG